MNKDKNIEYELPEQKVWEVREPSAEYKVEQKFTYEDYCTWSDDERWELIDGKAFRMEAPNRYHQKISMNLAGELYLHLKGNKCEVYAAPFDVRLNVGEGSDTVVQPDIMVFCDREVLDEIGAKGAPDLVIEILSPSTRDKDCTVKLKKYKQHGVKEYWVVDPLYEIVTIYLLEIDDVTTYLDNSVVDSTILQGFAISQKDVFADD